MKKFNIRFTFVNGDQKTFVKYESKNYSHVAAQVMEISDGWFGTKGELINLSNVLSCKIIEIDDEGYEVKENN